MPHYAYHPNGRERDFFIKASNLYRMVSFTVMAPQERMKLVLDSSKNFRVSSQNIDNTKVGTGDGIDESGKSTTDGG
jgi:hypothetical protein